MARYNPNAERLGSQARALRQIAKDYPDEYKKICEKRKLHAILYNLPVERFDEICITALYGLVREGICKRPKEISFNQR